MDARHTIDLGGPGGPRQTGHHPTGRGRGRRLLLGLTLAAALAPVAGLGTRTVHAASNNCSTNGDQVTCTFTYIAPGGPQTWTVPAGVTQATVDVFGAQGGNDVSGGRGGETRATIPVTPGATLQVTVGGRAFWANNQSNNGSGGYNGGGNGGGGVDGGGGGGGGASDVRVSPFGLADRIIVAGGGGGGIGWGDGGNGGGLSGQGGQSSQSGNGAGGSQSAGGAGACADACGGTGSLGSGGAGGSTDPGDEGAGGGGGGGYYGGGGGSAAVDADPGGPGAGGGGSSYVTPAATASVLIQGVNAGAGKVLITYDLPVAATTTTLVSSANPSVYGQSVTLTASVAGTPGLTPTGTITFTNGATTLGTATLDGTGTATYSTSSLGAGSHSLTAVYGGDATDTGSASAPLTQQVDPAPLTVTANNKTMTYGGSVPAFDASFSGFVNGDTSSVVSGLTCGAADGNGSPVSSSTSAGTYAITCSGGSAANYAISDGAGTLTIGPAPLTVMANDKQMTYGSGLPAFDASYSGFVTGDSAASLSSAPTCTTSATGSSPVGSYLITCASAADPNYTISYQPGTLTMAPAALTIAANDKTMAYGGPVPSFDASYSGLVNGDSSSVVSGLTCGAADGSGNPIGSSTPAGTYPITCSGASAANYAISYTGGTLTITQASQAITFGTLPNHTLGDAPVTVAATGGASGNPVTFSAGPSSVCTSGGSTGATIALVGVGTCTVTATQAGNANYQAAPSVSQSFSVAYPPLSLALNLSSSPSGPITMGSVVTASLTLGNHTSAAQTVDLKVTLAYTGSHGSLKITVPLTLKLNAGQTLSQSAHFTIQSWFPRGTYTLSAAATAGSGDTAGGSATLTVS